MSKLQFYGYADSASNRYGEHVYAYYSTYDQFGFAVGFGCNAWTGLRGFISEHRLAPEVNVLDADFWNDGQRQLLKEMLCSDGEWALVVDQLNEALRAPDS